MPFVCLLMAYQRCGDLVRAHYVLAQMQAQAAAYQTARLAYANALKQALPTVPVGDTLKFN